MREDELRAEMVIDQIAGRGVKEHRVLDAMRTVPRHLFVPSELRAHAYDDTPLAIGKGQTISQPYIVGYMCERLSLDPSHTVLDIGTGSGYQAAVLSRLAGRVLSVEIIEVLFRRARRLLASLGYDNVECICGDGAVAATEHAPFDAIVSAAAVRRFPISLLKLLCDGGIALFPEGAPAGYQQLVEVVRRGSRFERTELMGVRFVPMTGRAGRR